MAGKRAGYLILGLSLVGMVFSGIIFGVGAYQSLDIDVEEEAVFSGASGSIQVENYGYYSAYVASEYACEDVEVSIYTEDDEYVWEYFYKDCDQFFDVDGWTYVGYFSSDLDGSLNVDSSARILIVEDDLVDDGGLAILLSVCLGCCGLFGFVIGIVVLITAKEGATKATQQIIYVDSRSAVVDNEPPDAENPQEWWGDLSDS